MRQQESSKSNDLHAASSNVMQPMIQVQGYCPEPLASLTYSLSNAAGVLTNQQAFVLNQYYATNTWEFTTNTFQAFDVPLAAGANVLTFYAADLAGNVTATNMTYTLSYAGRSNPPVVQLYWPRDGTHISGSNFTVRGMVDDFTTSLQATITDTNGDTNTVSGIVKRDGKFWIENLPLAPGSNELTLTATDAATNVSTNTITVMGSSLVLTVNVDSTQLWQFTQNVSGTISDPTCSVWVNGVEGVTNGDGVSWSATNVPINAGGTAVFQVRAIAASDNGGAGSGGGGTVCYSNLANPSSATAVDMESPVDKPDRLYVNNYTLGVTQTRAYSNETVLDFLGILIPEPSWGTSTNTSSYSWTDAQGGSGTWSGATQANGGTNCACTAQESWPASYWGGDFYSVHGIETLTGCYDTALFSPVDIIDPPLIAMEHCEVNAPTNSSYGGGWASFAGGELGGGFEMDSGWQNTIYIRNAQAAMHYNTGGKAVSGAQNFYLFTATATDASGNPIPPQLISIGGLGHLDTNGNLWVVLPNGGHDATVRVDGSNYFTFTNNATKYTLTGVPQCFVGNNPYRTSLGIGEPVTCSVTPPVAVNWSLSGGGSISATNGRGITFEASTTPLPSAVTMSIANVKLTMNYSVTAPTGVLGTVRTNNGLGAAGPPNRNIGASTTFNAILQPTNVSFMFMTNLEVVLSYTVTFPNGTTLTLTPGKPDTTVFEGCDDGLIDTIKDGPFPASYLFNGINYQDLSYTMTYKYCYLNADDIGIKYATLTVTTTFSGSTLTCQETWQGCPGSVQGPWQ
jgi:hypothetical protein